jgi:hypothetical protein
MGILRKGIFDGFENKTGPLIGRRVKGKSVISAVQHRTTKPRTQAQLDQQLKFELVVRFLCWFKGLIAVGFRDPAGKRNSFNTAIKYNFKNIITGASPDYQIDYPKLVYSRGSLFGPNNPTVGLGAYEVAINWQPDGQNQFNQHTDKASFLVYCPGKNAFVILISLVERSALGYSVAIPQDFAGHQVHVFMSFVSADGKVVSDSAYLGSI